MKNLIAELKESGHTTEQIQDALCDGQFLSNYDFSQEEVEEAYSNLEEN